MEKGKARHITIQIMKVILNENNGYSMEEIDAEDMAEECETDELFQRIQALIEKY